MIPPPKLKISEWADQERKLSPESSAEPGSWDTDRAPYQRGIMDSIIEPEVRKVVFMKSAQVGWTELLNNVLGYYMDHDPCPILVVQPTLQMCQAWSKDRLQPMLRDTPALRDKVKEAKSRDSENTVLHKKFAGGHLTAVGANSPSGLASRPIRIVICDEIDRFPASAGTEGNPRKLAEKRQKTFWNKKTLVGGTPTIKGLSEVEAEFENSDQRFYYVPCPHCKEKQTLKWSQVQWPKDEPEKAGYFCEHCEKEISHNEKHQMLLRGEWVASKPFNGVAGFFINELYSPWVTWREMVRDWIESQKSKETLQTFINTSLGETFEDYGEQKNPDKLFLRKEDYQATVPAQVKVLTAGIDVQKDRIEYEIIGWGEGKESWGIKYEILLGDPNLQEVWKQLTERMRRTFEHEEIGLMRIACATIDSGGMHTQIVYNYCKPQNRPIDRFYAIKGKDGEGRPIANPRDAIGYPARRKVLIIGVDTAKSSVYSHLDIEEPGPAYCHFPNLPEYNEEYFKQLTAEKVITKMSKGFPVRVWQKIRPRNEALDIRSYNFAALEILNPDLKVVSMQARKNMQNRAVSEKATMNSAKRRNKFGSRGNSKSSWFRRG